jgi:hypothetical protein
MRIGTAVFHTLRVSEAIPQLGVVKSKLSHSSASVCLTTGKRLLKGTDQQRQVPRNLANPRRMLDPRLKVVFSLWRLHDGVPSFGFGVRRQWIHPFISTYFDFFHAHSAPHMLPPLERSTHSKLLPFSALIFTTCFAHLCAARTFPVHIVEHRASDLLTVWAMAPIYYDERLRFATYSKHFGTWHTCFLVRFYIPIMTSALLVGEEASVIAFVQHCRCLHQKDYVYRGCQTSGSRKQDNQVKETNGVLCRGCQIRVYREE